MIAFPTTLTIPTSLSPWESAMSMWAGTARVDGSIISGPSVSDLVKAKAPDADKSMRARLQQTLQAMTAIVRRAENVEAYDQMIGEGNAAGNAVVQSAIDALLEQTKAIERAVSVLELKAI